SALVPSSALATVSRAWRAPRSVRSATGGLMETGDIGGGGALRRRWRQTGVLVNHVSLVPNHMHNVMTATRRNLPIFKRLFVGEASKFIKAYLQARGFEAPENVFTRTHEMRLVNAAAQLVYLHYEDIQPVKDGLVERCRSTRASRRTRGC
ncbi:MAG: hypothetical protein RLO52_35325, partial [Sandaracinaceae bacterium]